MHDERIFLRGTGPRRRLRQSTAGRAYRAGRPAGADPDPHRAERRGQIHPAQNAGGPAGAHGRRGAAGRTGSDRLHRQRPRTAARPHAPPHPPHRADHLLRVCRSRAHPLHRAAGPPLRGRPASRARRAGSGGSFRSRGAGLQLHQRWPAPTHPAGPRHLPAAGGHPAGRADVFSGHQGQDRAAEHPANTGPHTAPCRPRQPARAGHGAEDRGRRGLRLPAGRLRRSDAPGGFCAGEHPDPLPPEPGAVRNAVRPPETCETQIRALRPQRAETAALRLHHRHLCSAGRGGRGPASADRKGPGDGGAAHTEGHRRGGSPAVLPPRRAGGRMRHRKGRRRRCGCDHRPAHRRHGGAAARHH